MFSGVCRMLAGSRPFPGNKHKIQANTENSDLYEYDGHIVTYIRQKYFPG